MEVENLIKLIEAVSKSELTGFKYEEDGVKLNLTKKTEEVRVIDGGNIAVAAPAASSNIQHPSDMQNPSAETDNAFEEGKIVRSPLVGTFYAAPAEDAEPFVSVGDSVKKGQVLAIVEAMKLMNEIESEYDGVVAEVLTENGQAVEYGQPLFRIR